ncbi:hypothetical protein F5Y12DRAFT_800291 [Xylaria sp. FL1777]|nr:hypothetical protein F5Y12DRAFT_800291 [Xylaria sp. FL1777]
MKFKGTGRLLYVAPQAKPTYWCKWHTTSEQMFPGNKSISILEHLLIIPIRPRYHLCPLSQLQLDRTPINTAVVTIFNLPPEIHHMIFSFIHNPVDIVCLAFTNRYFWSLSRQYLFNYILCGAGTLAGCKIACVDEDVRAGNYPPGMLSAEEQEVVRRKKYPYDETPTILQHFGANTSSASYKSVRRTHWLGLKIRCGSRDLGKDPAFNYVWPHLWPDLETIVDVKQPWILRNLTTKQFVRSEAIALSEKYIHGPYIEYFGFGELVVMRSCWTSSPLLNMKSDPTKRKGPWAGHRFDITRLSRHEEQTRGEEWMDISDEIASEIATIWEAEYGPEWRTGIVREGFRIKMLDLHVTRI